MTVSTYDVLVLGGGTAGTAAARTAAASGARTLLFNAGPLGGLCILRGCMPTKTMLHAAHLVHDAGHHATPGVGHADLAVDFAAVMANKDAKVARFKAAKVAAIEAGGYQVVDAHARFTGPDTVEAAGAAYRFAKGAVIATGSVPSLPDLPGLEGAPFLTSDDVIALTERPATAVVIGTGAVGLELAQFLCRVGTAVQLVSRRPVFAAIDPVLSEEMEKALAAEPRLELVRPAVPRAVRGKGAGVELDVELPGAARTLWADALVVATGRQARLQGLGLDAAGVRVADGAVVCGRDMRTTNPRVFVAGDATGRTLLLHVANWEGTVAGLGAAQVPGEHCVERRLDLQVVFTDPPLATIGLTEAQARAAGCDVVTALARFPETGRAITQDVRFGVWKVVAARDGEILGSQILGPRADDLVHVLSTLMYYRGKASDLLHMPWYHPTLSEVLLGLARDLVMQTA